jgi:hypothetical protein
MAPIVAHAHVADAMPTHHELSARPFLIAAFLRHHAGLTAKTATEAAIKRASS